jgi:Na+/H+-dicarboxylate symporter
MPLTIGVFIAYTVGAFKQKAFLFVITIMIFESISNFSCVWYAYLTGNLASHHISPFVISNFENAFEPLWRIRLIKPSWWSADKGAFCGLFFGCIAALTRNQILMNNIKRSYIVIEWILIKLFARLIPIFILGFITQVYQMRLFNYVLLHYSSLIVYLVCFIVLYVLSLFIIGAHSSVHKVLLSIENLLPAGAIALISGCSLSTMPATIEGTAKNLDNPELAKAVIPATTNIQQVGDSIANSFLCFLIYNNFYGHNPDFLTWMQFSIMFVLARFATTAVLGGAIVIMIPIYELYLNFNAEMVAIILALNVILDPIITSSNVIANGALCRIFEIVWSKLSSKIYPEKNIIAL